MREVLSVTIFVTLCFTVFELSCYRYVDDWVYMHGKGSSFSEFWNCVGGDNTSLSDAWTSCVNHYIHTNGRFADKLLIFLNLAPLWVARLILGFSFGLIIWFAGRISASSTDAIKPLPYMIMLWLIMIFAPWNHQFASISVGCNYLLSAAFVLAFSQRFLDPKPLTGRHCAFLTIFAVIAGAMHESFSISVSLGLAAVIISGYRPSARHILLLGGFIAGLVILMLSPSTAGRIDSAGWNLLNLSWLTDNLLRVPALWLMPVSGGVFLICRGWRNLVRKEELFAMIFLVVTALGAMFIALAIGMRGRSMWFASVLMCVLAVMFVRLSLPRLFNGRHIIAVSLLCIALGAWLLWVAAVQRHYSQQLRALEDKVKTTGSPLVAMDLDNFYDTPPLLFGLPQAPMSECYYDSFFYSFSAMKCSLLPGTPGSSLVVIPERLNGLHYTNWPKTGNDFYGEFPLYYVPGDAPELCREMTFDISAAPVTVWNTKARLAGETKVTVNLCADDLTIDSSMLDPSQRQMFADSQGVVPDTLHFAYITMIPRPLQYAPLVDVH